MSDKKQTSHPYHELTIDYSTEWIIPGSDDDKGHNVTEKFTLQKTWVAQMDRMVKSQKFPYINRGQIERHALYMLFAWIDTLPQKQLPKSDLSRIESMRSLLIEEAMLAGFNDVITELDKRVKYCKSRGMTKRAARHVLDILRIAEELKEEDWREHFVDKIKTDYKSLLDSIEDVNLYNKDDE